MSKPAKIIGDIFKDIATAAAGVELHDRFKNGNNPSDSSRLELMTFIHGLDKDTQAKFMTLFEAFDSKGRGDWFMNILAEYFKSLKLADTSEAIIKTIFTEISDEPTEKIEIRLRMMKNKTVGEGLKETWTKLDNKAAELAEELRPIQDRLQNEVEKQKKMSWWERFKDSFK